MQNNSRKVAIALIILVLLACAAAAHYWYNRAPAEAPQDGQVAGEMDDSASIPDGTPVTADVKLGETKRIAGVSINPTEVVEESRCPTGVQCIQAGTVRVSAMVTARGGNGTPELTIFALGVPITVGLDQITLIAATPAPKSGSPITPNDYVFTFTVVKGGGTEYFKG